jgi:L-ascorbate metabolism protein UlaG (beta-lactamase superfamily)
MQPAARLLAAAAFALFALPALAQQADDPVPSQCIAIAQSLPKATFASYSGASYSGGPLNAQAISGDGEVTITYAGHATYVIETPAGVRIATDFNGTYGSSPLPRIVTMNKAHSGHHTLYPDPGIEYPLPGWGDANGPAKHALVVDDVYVRNVPTDIRSYGGGMEVGGNSIFIFEVAGLCIGHLGHLHHHLEDAHYAAIGRLDIVMVPIDGGMTLSAGAMSEIVKRLFASIVLPMHRNWTPLSEFTSRLADNFMLDFRQERSFSVSLRTLPRRPTVIVLEGV